MRTSSPPPERVQYPEPENHPIRVYNEYTGTVFGVFTSIALMADQMASPVV
jgi:hypothetical protein